MFDEPAGRRADRARRPSAATERGEARPGGAMRQPTGRNLPGGPGRSTTGRMALGTERETMAKCGPGTDVRRLASGEAGGGSWPVPRTRTSTHRRVPSRGRTSRAWPSPSAVSACSDDWLAELDPSGGVRDATRESNGTHRDGDRLRGGRTCPRARGHRRRRRAPRGRRARFRHAGEHPGGSQAGARRGQDPLRPVPRHPRAAGRHRRRRHRAQGLPGRSRIGLRHGRRQGRDALRDRGARR